MLHCRYLALKYVTPITSFTYSYISFRCKLVSPVRPSIPGACSIASDRRFTPNYTSHRHKLSFFCISVSWMCNPRLTPTFASLSTLRLRVKSRTRKAQRRERRERTEPYIGDHVARASWASVAAHSWLDRLRKKRSLCRVPGHTLAYRFRKIV